MRQGRQQMSARQITSTNRHGNQCVYAHAHPPHSHTQHVHTHVRMHSHMHSHFVPRQPIDEELGELKGKADGNGSLVTKGLHQQPQHYSL